MKHKFVLIVVALLTLMGCNVGNDTKTVSDIAIKSNRPKFVPRYSDVCFSSRWRHPKNENDTHNTFRDAKDFHATRFEWVYSFDPEWIRECKKQGYSFGGTLNSKLPDAPGKPTKNKGRIYDKEGQLVTAPWMHDAWWGCVNSPEYKESFLAHAKLLVDGGVDFIHIDDPDINVRAIEWGGCYCKYCQEKAKKQGISLDEDMKSFQESSVKEFYTYIRKELDSYAGYHVHFSSNNYNGKSGFPYDLFEYGIAELPEESGTPELIYSKFNEALRENRAQTFTYVSLDVSLTRRVIAMAYACGGHILAPYDVYHENHERIFGKPEKYADLYGFVRANAKYLDGYEDAAIFGEGLKEERYGDTLPMTIDTKGIYVFARARPDEPDAPVVVHAIDWRDTAKPFMLKLRTDCFFSGKPIKAKLLVPPSYNRKAHKKAEEQNDFSLLSKEQEVKIKIKGDYTEISVPSLSPWGMIVLDSQ